MRRSGFRSRKRRLRAGALLVDVMIGILILILATVTLMSLFPVAMRGEEMSSDESKAVQMTTRLIEHVQMLGVDDVNGETLSSLNLIDDSSSVMPYSFTHVPLDEASIYSPAQVLRDAEGEIMITVLPDGSKQVDVELTYITKSGEKHSVKTGTIVGAFRG